MTLEQAATGQLETALDLWFHDKDIVSIHTLACAANGIVRTVARERNIDLRTTLIEYLETKPKKFRELMRSPQNFFKHGNPKVETYNPNQAEIALKDAVASYLQVFDKLTPIMSLYFSWVDLFESPELQSGEFKAMLMDNVGVEYFAGMSKAEFFEKFLPVISDE